MPLLSLSKNLVEFAANAAKKFGHLFRGHVHRKRFLARSAVCAVVRERMTSARSEVKAFSKNAPHFLRVWESLSIRIYFVPLVTNKQFFTLGKEHQTRLISLNLLSQVSVLLRTA